MLLSRHGHRRYEFLYRVWTCSNLFGRSSIFIWLDICIQQALSFPSVSNMADGNRSATRHACPRPSFQMLPCMLAPGSHFARLFAGVPIKEKLRPTEYALCRSHYSSWRNLWLIFFSPWLKSVWCPMLRPYLDHHKT